jgi:hypothetical protein
LDKTDGKKLQVTADMPRYTDGINARDILEQLKDSVSSFVGNDCFAADCSRYLRYLTTKSLHHSQLKEELRKLPSKPTWEQCESLFIRVTMDQQQRVRELINLLKGGMTPDETYTQFSLRIARNIRIYGISDNNEIILAQLQGVMPEALSIGIALHNKFTHGDQHDPEVKSINELLKLIASIPGLIKHQSTKQTTSEPKAAPRKSGWHSSTDKSSTSHSKKHHDFSMSAPKEKRDDKT